MAKKPLVTFLIIPPNTRSEMHLEFTQKELGPHLANFPDIRAEEIYVSLKDLEDARAWLKVKGVIKKLGTADHLRGNL